QRRGGDQADLRGVKSDRRQIGWQHDDGKTIAESTQGARGVEEKDVGKFPLGVHAQSPRTVERCAVLGRPSTGETACPHKRIRYRRSCPRKRGRPSLSPHGEERTQCASRTMRPPSSFETGATRPPQDEGGVSAPPPFPLTPRRSRPTPWDPRWSPAWSISRHRPSS